MDDNSTRRSRFTNILGQTTKVNHLNDTSYSQILHERTELSNININGDNLKPDFIKSLVNYFNEIITDKIDQKFKNYKQDFKVSLKDKMQDFENDYRQMIY